MVKSNIKKAFAVLFLLFAVVLPFTACGKGKGEGSGKEDTPEYVMKKMILASLLVIF